MRNPAHEQKGMRRRRRLNNTAGRKLKKKKKEQSEEGELLWGPALPQMSGCTGSKSVAVLNSPKPGNEVGGGFGNDNSSFLVSATQTTGKQLRTSVVGPNFAIQARE